MHNGGLLTIINFILIHCFSFGQFQSVEIGVNGLTCSACTRSVEMSIRKLSFVDSVSMDLNNVNGKIFFKEGEKVYIEAIANAVTNAGFSMRYLHAEFNFNNLQVTENFCWKYQDSQYQFIKIAPKTLHGPIALQFVDKKYLPRKENKKWKATIIAAKGKGCNINNIYYVSYL